MAGYFVNGSKDGKSVKDFSELDQQHQELILAAIEARKNAYCPYSKFAVGAAFRTESGQIYSGCNIENSSYPSGICAERTAVSKAISEGHRAFIAGAVVGQQENSFTTPCGICRQFLSEFAKNDFPIFLAKPISPPLRVQCTSIYELLPNSFKLGSD